MTANTKSLILLASTLIVGFVLGLFADAMLVRARRDRIADMRRPPGLMAHLERVIEPRDSAQADTVRAVLRGIAAGNSEILRGANERLRAHMDSARVVLAPLLDDEQRARLDAEIGRLRPMGIGGGPGGRGRGGRGGPPPGGRGFPPPPP
jgi:hypothetical protein